MNEIRPINDIVLCDATGRPKPMVTPRNAQMSTKIYFWWNPRTQHILQGGGPQFDSMMPPGYERITCNHAYEAEAWSKRLTEQDKRIAEMTDYEREQIEGPMREDLRKELRHKLANLGDSKNASLNAMMLRTALKKLDEQEASATTVRESYLHVEAFENGK